VQEKRLRSASLSKYKQRPQETVEQLRKSVEAIKITTVDKPDKRPIRPLIAIKILDPLPKPFTGHSYGRLKPLRIVSRYEKERTLPPNFWKFAFFILLVAQLLSYLVKALGWI